jgi:dihydroflavonol-4-reductase
VKVLVTGATGFIGGRLVRQLLDAGYEVRALVRAPDRAEGLARAGIELASGDVSDPTSLERALVGVEGVFHLAAVYDFGLEARQMWRVNVEGTRNVLDAAARAGTPRILYCGSDTSLGDTRGELGDETRIHDGHDRSAYEATKREAHQLVSERARGGAPVINAIVSTVYGPGDSSVIGELIENHLAGRLIVTLDRSAGYTFAHVDDVATALRLAFEKGRLGESYLISGTPARFGDFFQRLSSVSGIAPPAVELPGWLITALMPLLTLLGRAVGKSPAAIRELVAMGRHVTRFFSSEKARRELGWKPRDLEQGLADTVPWFAAREREAAAKALGRTRVWLAGLALLDFWLGAQAAFFPQAYVHDIHARFFALHPSGPLYWAVRIGFVWLFFCAVETLAALAPRRRVLLVLIVGALRLMEVPADVAYRLAADDLGSFGRIGLLLSPIFNGLVGTYLCLTACRAIRAGLAATATRTIPP